MTRDLVGAARLLLVPTVALVAVVSFLPGRAGLAVRVYGLLLCAVALAVTLAALRRAYPRTEPLAAQRVSATRRRRPPPSLARLETETALGVGGAFDFHHRLRPRLRELAQGLLETRRRVSLDAEPDAARRILGDETWSLVRQDRPPPEDRLARGIPPDDLRRAVESLERV